MFNDPVVLYAIAQLFRLLVEGVFGETVCCLVFFSLCPGSRLILAVPN